MELPELDPLPNLGSLSDDDLKQLIDRLQQEEQVVSYRRRLLHGKIDILRAELQARLKETGVYVIVVSEPASSLTSSVPQREQ